MTGARHASILPATLRSARPGDRDVAVYLALITGLLDCATRDEVARAYWVAAWLLPRAPHNGSAWALAERFVLQRADEAPTQALRRACERLCLRHRLVAPGFTIDDEGPTG